MMTRLKVLMPVCVLGVLSACSDGLLHEPAPPVAGSVALSAAMFQGGTAEAYAQANTLWLRFSEGDETRLETLVPFNADAEEVRVGIQVPMRETTETFLLRMELRRDADAIFQGSADITLRGGQTEEVDIPLQPVVAGVSCGGAPVELDAYGATAQLTAAVLFVTGDTVPSAGIQWSTGSEAAVTVDADGIVLAQYDGTAIVTCTAGGATDTRTVIVSAVVTSVSVAPAQAAVLIGGSTTFAATARDRLENVIPGRTTVWSSAAPAVAQVDQAGVALGVSAGTARIDAMVDGVTGSGTLTVSSPPPGPPSVRTVSAYYVPNSDAFLEMNGAATPNGSTTTVYFEWSQIDSTLVRPQTTQPQTIAAGWTEIPFSDGFFSNFQATWVRAVAVNQYGAARGVILRVDAGGTGPAVESAPGTVMSSSRRR